MGAYAKSWHANESKENIARQFAGDMQKMENYLHDAFIARRFLHGDVEPVAFHRVTATDDDARAAEPVMRAKPQPRQLTFVRHEVSGVVKIAARDPHFEQHGFKAPRHAGARVAE